MVDRFLITWEVPTRFLFAHLHRKSLRFSYIRAHLEVLTERTCASARRCLRWLLSAATTDTAAFASKFRIVLSQCCSIFTSRLQRENIPQARHDTGNTIWLIRARVGCLSPLGRQDGIVGKPICGVRCSCMCSPCFYSHAQATTKG